MSKHHGIRALHSKDAVNDTYQQRREKHRQQTFSDHSGFRFGIEADSVQYLVQMALFLSGCDLLELQ